ncbi:hypothetical protein H6P81_003703 [Aristolochia fimbriata]|uniref:Reverse transcriptase Ty1/copia-type domain-containing protein n=1 Tax=Aristolochia fimbriata TaxID=158543 RepID=A0AAV7FDD0_ARIFI|nr:hypothetical protein H6P81_003703 [Aristolochia fimbriata]
MVFDPSRRSLTWTDLAFLFVTLLVRASPPALSFPQVSEYFITQKPRGENADFSECPVPPGPKTIPDSWTYITLTGCPKSTNNPSLIPYLNSIYQTSGSVLVLIDVHDGTVIGSDSQGIRHLKDALHHEVIIKDMGDLHYFLCIEIVCNSSGFHLSQGKYVADQLHRLHH